MKIGFKYNGVCFLQNYFANSNIIRTFAMMKINDCMRCFEHNTLILTPPQKTNGLIRWENPLRTSVSKTNSAPISSVERVIYSHLTEGVSSALSLDVIQR